jgi:hypothetical protein
MLQGKRKKAKGKSIDARHQLDATGVAGGVAAGAFAGPDPIGWTPLDAKEPELEAGAAAAAVAGVAAGVLVVLAVVAAGVLVPIDAARPAAASSVVGTSGDVVGSTVDEPGAAGGPPDWPAHTPPGEKKSCWSGQG